MTAASPVRTITAVRLELLNDFFFQAEDGIRDLTVTGVQTCALPISGLDAAFDEDQRTLLKILLSNFSLFAPHDDLVPLGPLLALAVFVFVRLIRGNGEICDGLAAAGVAGFGIAA